MCTVKKLFCSFLVSLHLKCLVDARKCFQDYSFGECVPVLECDHLVDEIAKAGNPMPLYMADKLQDLSCGYNGSDPLVCCIPPEETDIEKPQIPNVKDVTEIPDIQNHPNLGLLPTNCGMGSENRIFGGTRAALFEMPWMVLLSYESVLGPELNCDGTIINEWYVLTAAHCVKFLPSGLQLTHVRLGEYDLDHNPDCQVDYGIETCAPEYKTVAIAEVISHPGYTKDSLIDDIAILRLSEPADFSLASIMPICLPLTPKLQQEKILGKSMIVAGWGKTEQDTHQSKAVLLKVFVPVVSKEVCQNAYSSAATIHNNQICAGGDGGKDSCKGDSGGPLMDRGRLGSRGIKTIQRGIVSYGHRICGQAGIPAVYTNVAYFMDWILDNMHS